MDHDVRQHDVLRATAAARPEHSAQIAAAAVIQYRRRKGWRAAAPKQLHQHHLQAMISMVTVALRRALVCRSSAASWPALP